MRNDNFVSRNNSCMTITGLILSIIAFAILIWGVADIEFKRKGVMTIYIMSFTLVILCMLGFIGIVILLNSRKSENFRIINGIGRFITLVIFCMSCIAFIFLLIAMIILLVDYNDIRKWLKNGGERKTTDVAWVAKLDDVLTENKIADHEWAAVIVPSIISLICLILMVIASFISYRNFKEETNPNIANIMQNSTANINNTTQPGIFPNNNIPNKLTPNNIAYPVIISQTGNN